MKPDLDYFGQYVYASSDFVYQFGSYVATSVGAGAGDSVVVWNRATHYAHADTKLGITDTQ